MKTFFRSKIPILDNNGKVVGWNRYTYRRDKPKENHQEKKALQRRIVHGSLTTVEIPRRVDGQKLGLRKRLRLFDEREAGKLGAL